MTETATQHDGVSLLGLPHSARQDHRITKKLLTEQFEEQAPADARLLARALASAQLVAILRPETIQVPGTQDE